MSKLIALRSGFNDAYFHAWRSNFSSLLKQQALLFDQIGILKLNGMYETLGTVRQHPDFTKNPLEPLISELKWLEENGIIFEATIQDKHDLQDAELLEADPQKLEEIKKLNKLLKKSLNNQKEISSLQDKVDELDSIKKQHAIFLRMLSLVMETTKKVTVVTTLPYTEYTRNLPNSKKSYVAQIVVNKLPLPDNETPWEQIIDYRNDSESQKNLLTLRRWIRKISTDDPSSTEIEIEEELEWLMNEFQTHMKVHKMKENTATIEVLAKALPGTIENLIKLNFSKIPEPFFAVKKRKLSLMEAELNAPGKEISYIIKAQDAFQSNE